jgi:hypothetical protein
VRNPLRSEDAMFRFLLSTLAVAVAIVVVVYLVRAVT